MKLHALLVAVSLVAHVAPVLACSAGPCSSGFIAPDKISAPASHAAFLWVASFSWLRRKALSAPELAKLGKKVRLRRLDTNALVPVTLTQHAELTSSYWVRPTEGFVAGVEYTVDAPEECELGAKKTLHASMKITEPVATPTQLGRLMAAAPTGGDLTVATTAGSCSTEIKASWIDVSVETTGTARALADLFEYSTFVDGKPWKPTTAIFLIPRPDRSWVGHGRDRVFTHCKSANAEFGAPQFALAPGSHVVEMRARLPGSSTEIATDPIKVELHCAP